MTKKSLATKIAKTVSAAVKQNKSKNKNKNKLGRKPNRNKNSSSLGRSLFSGAGRVLGSLVGQPELGANAGASFAKILGMGAYRVNSNSIMNDSTQAPVFSKTDQGIVFSHSEFITDVVGSVAFLSRPFMIDPTNYTTFPYLATIASNFEQYEFLGLVFTYKPTSGSAIASTNNSLGTVILSTDYDVSRPPFRTKAEMEAFQYSTSVEPCGEMHHPVECNPHMDIINARYVNGPIRTQKLSTYASTTTPSVQANLQTLGRTQLAVVGMQTTVIVGELWVSYKIKLLNPRKPGSSNFQGIYHAVSNNTIPVGSATALASSFNVLSDSTTSLGNVDFIPSGTNSRLYFQGLPPGTCIDIILSYNVTATTSTTTQSAFSNTNLTQYAMYGVNDGTNGNTSFQTAQGQTQQSARYAYTTNDDSYTNPCYAIIPAPTVATAAATWDLMVYVTTKMTTTSTGSAFITNIVEREIENTNKFNEMVSLYNKLNSHYSIGVIEEESKDNSDEESFESIPKHFTKIPKIVNKSTTNLA